LLTTVIVYYSGLKQKIKGEVMLERLVTTKELAEILKVSVATVNYYTNIGLFKICVRKGNMRLYDKKGTVRGFENIKHLRNEGYSLKLICKRVDKEYSA